MTRAGGQEHRQPTRRANMSVLGPRQLARHTGLGHVRIEAGVEGGGDGNEDECVDALHRRDALHLRGALRDVERHVVHLRG